MSAQPLSPASTAFCTQPLEQPDSPQWHKAQFLALLEVPFEEWSDKEIQLLEEALRQQSEPTASKASKRNLEEILSRLAVSVEDSPAEALRLGLLLLCASRSGRVADFGLRAVEGAANDAWLLQGGDRVELEAVLRKMACVQYWTERAEAVLRRLKPQSLLLGLLPESGTPWLRSLDSMKSSTTALRSAATGTMPQLQRAATAALPLKPRQRPATRWEREVLPKDPVAKPPLSFNGVTVSLHPWQPSFLGAQFSVPTQVNRPVGRLYFEDYCKPPTASAKVSRPTFYGATHQFGQCVI